MSPARRWLYGGLAVVGLVVVGGLVIAFLFRDTATPVTREEVAGTDVLVGTDPGDPGVYVYATTGGEEVDALSGARHDYPPETFAVVREAECGVIVRWVALEERWTEWTRCEGETFPRVEDSLHQWFGIPEPTTWTCIPGPLPELAPGTTWTEECSNGESVERATYEVVGFEDLTVGEHTVETVHLVRTASSSGRTEGSGIREEWVMRGEPLVVKGIYVSESVSSTAIGDVTYAEDYTIELVDLYPGS